MSRSHTTIYQSSRGSRRTYRSTSGNTTYVDTDFTPNMGPIGVVAFLAIALLVTHPWVLLLPLALVPLVAVYAVAKAVPGPPMGAFWYGVFVIGGYIALMAFGVVR